MGHEKTNRRPMQASSSARAGVPALCLTALCATLALAFFAAPAWAVDEHTFDPTLSLTGNCTTSAEDPVADPGCPGGSHPIKEGFDGPAGTAVDSFGDIYLSSPGTGPQTEHEGRIYVFNSSGEFLTEIEDPEKPLSLAVDPEGNLYALNQYSREAVLYAPESYPPAAGTVYTATLSLGEERNPGSGDKPRSVAVDPSNGHVYLAYNNSIEEFDSAANGSGSIDSEIGRNLGDRFYAVGVWGANHDVYATGQKAGSEINSENDRVLIFDGEDGHLKLEIDGSDEDSRAVTLSPAAAPGSEFVEWTGACSGSGACKVSMSAAKEVRAEFRLTGRPTFKLKVNKSGTGSGEVTSSPAGIKCGAGCEFELEEGTEVTLTAKATTGATTASTFSGWSGGGCSGTGTCKVTMSTAKEVNAEFKLKPKFKLTVTKSGPGSGTVKSSPSGLIECGATCSAEISEGTAVTLSPAADSGSKFSGWSGGGCSGTGTCTVTMSAAKSVNAEFTLDANPQPLTVTTIGAGSGEVTSSPAGIKCGASCEFEFEEGTVVTLIRIPDHSEFVEWGGACSGSSFECKVTMSEAQEVTAEFELQPEVPLRVTRTGNGSGTVTSSPAGINCGASCEAEFRGRVKLNAVADPGSEFVRWTGACARESTSQCQLDNLELAAVQEATAEFRLVGGFSLTVAKTGNGSGTVTSSPAGISCGASCKAEFAPVDLKIDKTPGNDFGFGSTGIAVDQANGDFYVGDVEEFEAVDQFRADGEFVTEIKHSLISSGSMGIAVDDPCLDESEEPCAGAPAYESPNEGHLFVTSGNQPSNSHLYAFEPPLFGAPEIQSPAAASITETEAVLRAEVNPNALATAYRFQYTTQADFEEDEYAGATTVPVPDGDAGSGGFFAVVSKQIGGLAPGTAYRFRIVAGNEEGDAEAEAGFSTYRPESGLADGRAYELVTPPDTNGRVPTMQEMSHNSNGNAFDTPLASPDGESVVFGVEGGSLPGMEGGGLHDTYEARRTSTGWQSHFTGVPGTLAPEVYVGGVSPDHGYSFWTVADDPAGQILPPGQYLRKPDGSFEALSGEGRWITANAGHVISVSSNHLTEDAPPAPMSAVYDRGGGTIRLVSLLPGNVTPGFGENASYIATSADGSAVAFKIGATMYLRVDGEETLEVATGNTVYGGLSAGGAHLFYLRPNPTEPLFNGSEVSQGEIFAYDVASEATTAIGSGEEAILVNVSADGSHAYFTSPEQLDGGEGEAGEQNLYLWDGSAVRFLATLTERDLVGEPGFGCNNCPADGLGLWVNGPAASYTKDSARGPGEDPSRSTAEGSVLLFESRANLTPYDSEGHAEIYRYEASSEETLCLSCNPTGAAAQSNAELQSTPGGQLAHFRPVNALSVIPNLSADGQKAFFQSADRLVPGDVDGKIDVYEWEAYGEGGCELAGGCVHLVSSGRSAGDDYLYAATPDGSDVFFESGDTLVPQDPDATPSIYDARVGGGFPPPSPPPGECLGEACQPAVAAPEDPTPASAGFEGPGNVEEEAAPKPRCAKGKHRVKGRCAARHSKKKQHRRHHRAHRNRRAGR